MITKDLIFHIQAASYKDYQFTTKLQNQLADPKKRLQPAVIGGHA